MNKAKSFWATIFSQAGFFWLVLLVFMAVSVTESGDFFNRAIVHDVAGGALGYAVAGTFDLLSIVFLLARLNASRIADRRGEWLSLLGVVVCAGVSAFANVATSVQSYDASQFNNIPAWMQQVSPFVALVFPAMIIFTSLIADHVGDLNPQRADSIEKYRAKEQKKVDLLRVRLEIERDMAGVRLEMAALRGKQSTRQGQALASLQAEQTAQIRELSAEVESLKMMLPPTAGPDTDALSTVTVQEVATAAPQKALDNESAGSGQQTTALLFESKEDAVKAALAANPTGDAKQIAGAAGCSVRTAQRWMDKLATAESEAR